MIEGFLGENVIKYQAFLISGPDFVGDKDDGWL
jgi:hypothetical protein